MKHLSRSILIAMLGLLCVFGADAKKKMPKKVFYDSKSWIVNVFGDAGYLKAQAMEPKIQDFPMELPVFDGYPYESFCKDVADKLTRDGYGREAIDILTKDGSSEEILRKLALANVQKRDLEFGVETMRADSGEDVANILAEDYLPVLTHCYLSVPFKYEVEVKDKDTKQVRKETRITHALYRVDVSNEEAFDIMSSLGDPERYNQLKYNVSYCTNETFYDDIIKDVPDMAVRGVLTQRNPARISIGSNMGIQKGDLVSFYSQRMDKNGNPYSKRISRARVGKVWPDFAQVNFEANTAGNRKNGDIVVKTPDNHLRMGLVATWQPHIWGGELLFDMKTGFARSGIIHHFLMDLAFSMTDKPGNKFTVLEGEYGPYCVKAPMFANIGMGYGLGKTFLGFMDVMGFFIAQYEGSIMLGDKFMKNLSEDGKAETVFGSAIRIPIGLRLSFNMGYPTKLFLEGGYAVNLGLGNDAKIVKQSLKYMNARRDGIFLNLGFMF